jgi:tRNA pseudouridine55 synthase
MTNTEENACGSVDEEIRPHGLIPINKPPGPSSFDCIRIIRKSCSFPRKWKIGHLGTLDPFASGVLIIALGQAVRYAEYGLHSSKKYRARLWLGDETDTLDPLGSVIDTKPVPDDWKDRLSDVATQFTGTISQVPPAFSAKQVDGRRSYKAARVGEKVELKPIEVEVKSLEFGTRDENWVDFVAEVSSGTYIRALGRDIAKALGTVGHLIGLERIAAGPFTVDEAIPLESIKAGCTCAFKYHLHPVERILSHLPECIVHEAALEKISHGRKLSDEDFEDGMPGCDGDSGTVRIHDADGNFRALGRVKGDSIVPFKPWDAH